MKKVTVVVPIYNQEEYLERSISSILNQSYRNLQIVLVNDGSTDASESMIEKYKQQDSRIEVVHKTNGGLVDAILAGIRVAIGDYICFIDPDDYVGDDYIKTFISYMDDSLDFVATGFFYDNQGTIVENLLYENRIFEKTDMDECRNKFIVGGDVLEPSRTFSSTRCNKLYKLDIIKCIARHYCECLELSLGEDSLFTYFLLQYAKRSKTIMQANTYYYDIGNQGSMMHSKSVDEYFKRGHIAFDMLYDALEKGKNDTRQAYMFYYLQMNYLLNTLLSEKKDSFCYYYKRLKEDSVYGQAIAIAPSFTNSVKDKFKIYILKHFHNGLIYYYIVRLYKWLKVFKCKFDQG